MKMLSDKIRTFRQFNLITMFFLKKINILKFSAYSAKMERTVQFLVMLSNIKKQKQIK